MTCLKLSLLLPVFLCPILLVAQITIQFVAADRPEQPLVSDLVDFRESPDGGLIATQWVSGVKLGAKELFPIQSDDPLLKKPEELVLEKEKPEEGLDDILADLEKDSEKKEKAIRKVDQVDPQYVDQKLSDGRVIGPIRYRYSEANVGKEAGELITPGDISVKSDGKVLCYPVTFTALKGKDHIVFTPKLEFNGRDLLADCLFEHSPAMPLGDVAGRANSVSERLAATRGGKRDFRKLVLYLPSSQKTYRLNGTAFRVSQSGVEVAESSKVSKVGDFHLQIIVPVEEETGPAIPLAKVLDGKILLTLPSGKKISKATLQTGNLRDGFISSTAEITFQYSRSSESREATLPNDVPTGIARLQIPEQPSIPLLIAAKDVQGSVSLFTYHNRCDYLRGETVDVQSVLRGLKSAKGELVLTHESGESFRISTDFNSVTSIDTSGLRLGRYEVEASAQDSLVTYGTYFHLHSSQPATDFALYSWFANSFSGPIWANGQPVVNYVLSQKPSQHLPPTVLKEHSQQPAYPSEWSTAFADDPLLPAVETTERYDKDTELEAALALRLGMRYCPDYGWGMNGQEAGWNPKHTLPDELARIRRLCTQVTERHRQFGNVAGLHFNWYPRLNGNWEQHPPTDGNAIPRRQMLAEQVAQYSGLEAHKYRVGAFSRAYDAWTQTSRHLTKPTAGDPIYTSFPAVSWFRQINYHPPSFFQSLPVASLVCYTDYGFSPFQPLWALDYWTSGLPSDKPRWITSMSNGRDILLKQALLAVGRGADGIDLKGQDEVATSVIAEFLTRYGSYFRTLEPRSDVAILTSMVDRWKEKELTGTWMGYTGGKYYDLYCKLFRAGYPAAMLEAETVTLEQLQKHKAIFILGKEPTVPRDLLQQYMAGGGKVFENPEFEQSAESRWEHDKYRSTRDRFFVGNRDGYERISQSLGELLETLPAPMVKCPDGEVLFATLQGKESAVVFAVNDQPIPPGIHHNWNFWSANVLPRQTKLSFDKPYVLYDLMEGGQEILLEKSEDGRYSTPVSFDRCSGRAFLVLEKPIGQMSIQAPSEITLGGEISLKTVWEGFEDTAFPSEISVLNDQTTIYRPMGETSVFIPEQAQPGDWKVQVKDLVSGQSVIVPIRKTATVELRTTTRRVWIPEPEEVQKFLEKGTPVKFLIDSRQPLEVQRFARRISEDPTDVWVVDAMDVHPLPLRWRPNQYDQKLHDEAKAGEHIVMAVDRQSFQHFENGKLDVLHPNAGWQEPGARHRIYTDVILIGDPKDNRFLADLLPTVGYRSDRPTVQVIHDAFTPENDCLAVTASDLEGLIQAFEILMDLQTKESPPKPSVLASATFPASSRKPLPNLISSSFGASVNPTALTLEGDLFLSAGTTAANYFVLGKDGELKDKWLGKYAVRKLNSQKGHWTDTWWGTTGFVDSIVRTNPSRKPLWRMQLPRYSGNYSSWKHPGARVLVDPLNGDLIVFSQHYVTRIDSAGKVQWQYNDLSNCSSPEQFRFARDLMGHAISEDGKYLLVAGFGIEPYARIVSKFHRPSVMLMNAQNGDILWEKYGILVDHSVCKFLKDGRILIGDTSTDPKQLLVFDLKGKLLQSFPRPKGTSQVWELGEWMVLRPEAPRGQGRKILGPPEGLQAMRLSKPRQVLDFPVNNDIHSIQVDERTQRLLLSSKDGTLQCFALDTQLVWERKFNAPCNLLVADKIYAGTQTGKLLVLDPKGNTIRETDLMEHNLVHDPQKYVQEYTASPFNAEIKIPMPNQPVRLHEQKIPDIEFVQKKGLTFQAEAGDYLLSFLGSGPTGSKLAIEITSGNQSIYSAQLAASATQQEYTVAWKVEKPSLLKIETQPEDGVQVQQPLAFHMKYPTENLLLHKQPDIQSFESGKKPPSAPPSVKLIMPNDVSLTARARGEPPFPAVIPVIQPFDGKVFGQKTSWLGKPANGSSHTRMELKFSQPQTLTSLTLYEDPSAPTTEFAIFAKDAKSGKSIQLGHRLNNLSPFNLFTFPETQIESLSYIRLTSPDGHARLAEMEAYGVKKDELDLMLDL